MQYEHVLNERRFLPWYEKKASKIKIKRYGLQQRSRDVTRAYEMLPYPVSMELETNLVRMIKTRLKGHAYLAIEDEPIYTIEKLIDTLKTSFQPSKSVNYYRGELNNTYKKPNEHVLDYIGRIKDLKSAILEGETKISGTLSERMIMRIETEALESLINGLPSELKIPLKMEKCCTVAQAAKALLKINQEEEINALRYKNNRTHYHLDKKCRNCGRTGHSDENCRNRPVQLRKVESL